MNIKTRYAEFKQRHNLDDADVVMYSIFAASWVTFVGLFAYAAVKDVKETKKVDEWTSEQYEAGRHVYQLANGSLIATDKIHVY